MNTDIASVLQQPNRLVEWAEQVRFNGMNLSAENTEISEAMDAYIREGIGRTGADPNHEISQMITKVITPEVVSLPSAVMDALFDQSTRIGEFDDIRFEKGYENTIQVFDAIPGGNVNRSYVDFKSMKPTWVSLQAETEISLQKIRHGGYRTVADLINDIRDAFEYKKYAVIMAAVDGAIVDGGANYIEETAALPTATSADALSIYLMDVADSDTTSLIAFGQNKYIQAIAGLDNAVNFLTDAEKNHFNQYGLPRVYAGMNLYGFSGTKKLPDGTLIMPADRVFGVAGRIGQMATRGETIALQETDINSEKIHIKVNGYTFGYAITNPEKAAKIVLSAT